MAYSLNNQRLFQEYQNKPKPKTQCGSILSVMFSIQNLYLPAFEEFVDGFKKRCVENQIKVNDGSKVVMKNMERIFYKSYYVYRGDYSQLTDLLRCSLVFDSFGDLYKAFTVLSEWVKNNKDMKDGILRVKNLFSPERVPFGYRHLLVNVYCPGTELVCEIQFHHKLFYELKKENEYVYERARLFKCDDRNLAYDYVCKFFNQNESKKLEYAVYGHTSEENVTKNEKENEKEDVKIENGEEDLVIGVEVSMKELIYKWFPKSVAEIYYKALISNGYNTVKQLKDISIAITTKKQETLKNLQTMGFKTGHAKLFIQKIDLYFQSLKSSEEKK